jgi:acyl dehydratase
VTIYADDLGPGQEIALAAYTLTEDAIVRYAQEWDPIYIHTDPVAGRASGLDGVIASGLQTLAVYQRLAVQALWSRVAGGAGRAFEIRFRRPVRPGTTLSGHLRVRSVTPRPERGNAVVIIDAELTGDGGDVMLSVINESVLPLRPSGSP